jgi:murein DD-endopeptidase MepM/ murein hydrolase activator NlpD
MLVGMLARGCAAPAPDTRVTYRLPFVCGIRVVVTQGNRSGFNHEGVQAWAWDFGVARGTPVVAMAAGFVTHASNAVVPGARCWNGGGSECGSTVNYVVVAHDDGTSTLYLHLDAVEVMPGVRVTAGQRIGRSGNTGWSLGAHLHVQRQVRCESWFCESIALVFSDAAELAVGREVTSNHCL